MSSGCRETTRAVRPSSTKPARSREIASSPLDSSSARNLLGYFGDFRSYATKLTGTKEIKFSDVTSNYVSLYKQFIDVCLGPGDVEFFCFVADRENADPIERFGSAWDASKLAEQLIVAALHPEELMSLMADNYSTPDAVLFEEELKMRVNRRVHRLGLVSVCRLDSKSSTGLQAVDLLTSAVTFEFRAEAGLASYKNPKGILAAHVRQALGTQSCLGGWRNGQHSVAVYSHGSWTPGVTG